MLESELIPVPPTDENKSASPMQQSTNTQSKTYPTAFASSGSAALSGSSNSLFGTLGASSTSATPPSPINSSKLESTNVSHFSEGKGARKTETAASGAFGSLAKPSSIGFSASEPSPFAISGAGKSSVFGGSVFGGGFGSGFSGGGKLTNFAAPVGDTYLGSINGAIKPIGSPTLEGNNDKENSDDEGEGPGENGNDGSEEVDELFHRQDGKPRLSGRGICSDHAQSRPERTTRLRSFLPEQVFLSSKTKLGKKVARVPLNLTSTHYWTPIHLQNQDASLCERVRLLGSY